MTSWNVDEKLQFHTDDQVMEVDFSDLTFDVPADVHSIYDSIDERLEATGNKWFFLVNYRNTRIMSEAWISFAYRGKRTNLTYSLGSTRFAASGDTSEAILESAKEEKFDPNLFSSREAALGHLRALRNEIPEAEFAARLVPTPPSVATPPAERITFHDDMNVMEVDFSDCTFASSSDVNAFYDEITKQIEQTGRNWYFLVNYTNAEILPNAWYTWAARGKKLNAKHSLGTVRFNPHETTRKEIIRRARADEFDPNVAASREEALARIATIRNG